MMTNSEKYNLLSSSYTVYPALSFWEGTDFTTDTWGDVLRTELSMAAELPLVLTVHLPYSEQETACEGTSIVTSDHSLERPYVDAVLQEFKLFRELLGIPVVIKGIFFSGVPAFFAKAEKDRLVQGLIKGNRVAPGAELGADVRPGIAALAWMTIGLGASAISDVRVCLVQNETDVETYLTRVQDDWDIPVALGHQLTEEDVAIRGLIHELAAKGEIQLPKALLQDEFGPAISAELREMQADGLVTFSNERLQLTDAGRPFLRNVCRVLDLRLRRSQQQVAQVV